MGLDSAKASLRDIQGHIFQADYTNPQRLQNQAIPGQFLSFRIEFIRVLFQVDVHLLQLNFKCRL